MLVWSRGFGVYLRPETTGSVPLLPIHEVRALVSIFVKGVGR